MSLGFQRLNERTTRPNSCINFIKPLTGPDQALAQDFLERIAAQCYPVMKAEWISVMALEEHEPNAEFAGRNFNAGEVIQLVLKSRSGRWLPFKSVQMVMMHELAHCKQMNHSRDFWKVRNQYADEMRELWKRQYYGEGIWGKGQCLLSGQYTTPTVPDASEMPEHLCGGTYRSRRGRKRKRGAADEGRERPKTSYAERQQRRIAKKFGVNGQSLGADDLLRTGIEKGTNLKGKPRVASSKRGRELRASAALARLGLEKTKQETAERTPELEDDIGSELDWSDSEYGDADLGASAVDRNGKQITDDQGNGMVRVCGDDSERDADVKMEMDELNELSGVKIKMEVVENEDEDLNRLREMKADSLDHEDSETESETEADGAPPAEHLVSLDGANHVEGVGPPSDPMSILPSANTRQQVAPAASPTRTEPILPPQSMAGTSYICPICSLANEPEASTCMACSHVLTTSLMPNHWRCKSETCKGSKYINPSDAGRCGLCGAAKAKVMTGGTSEKAVGFGVTRPDVLRWD